MCARPELIGVTLEPLDDRRCGSVRRHRPTGIEPALVERRVELLDLVIRDRAAAGGQPDGELSGRFGRRKRASHLAYEGGVNGSPQLRRASAVVERPDADPTQVVLVDQSVPLPER